MIRTIKRFEVLETESAKVFAEQLNEASERLADNKPKFDIVRADGKHICYIAYEVTEHIEDEPVHHCGECSHFSPQMKADGTPDRRSNRGTCPHSSIGRSAGYISCDEFIEALKEVLI